MQPHQQTTVETEGISWPSTASVMTALCAAFLFHYLFNVSHKPVLYCGSVRFRRCLMDKLPELSVTCRPTFWCYPAHVQTILRFVIKQLIAKPSMPLYRREVIDLCDGGLISLDWVDNSNSELFPDDETRPTVLIMPGYTGCSLKQYVCDKVNASLQLGYRAVVFNRRGYGNVALKTPRTFCATDPTDMDAVMVHVQRKLPNSRIFVIAFSMGGIYLVNYLLTCDKSRLSPLSGCMLISVPWNNFATRKSLDGFVNHNLFVKHLLSELWQLLQKNSNVFDSKGLDKQTPVDLNKVFQCKSIAEYDQLLTCPMYGYESVDDYYHAATLHTKPFHLIPCPILSLNAADDPFSPEQAIPFCHLGNCPNVALVLTKYGGHNSFMEGPLGTALTLQERLFMGFSKLAFADDLQVEHGNYSNLSAFN